ncbi:MAG TPA: dephospho-CoA kinase [Pyrinomonadaceae bacterium]|jgi:dephospho-CoA kinase|nr:dephospho-CoA kinase [Pyrinomonadaceae bacterium]
MLRVGLTGSIGVGKSFVGSVFVQLGCRLLDADDTAREVVLPGTEGLKNIVNEFGPEVLQSDGALDRKVLGSIVFADPEKRQRLNAILHPRIIERQDEILNTWESDDPHGIAIVDAALMIESGGYKRFDKLIVVHCRPEVQLERLMLRDGLSPDEAQKRIDSQMPQSEKQKFADYLIDTSDGFELTRQRTTEVYDQLMDITRQQT